MKVNPYLILAGLSAIVVVFPFWKGQVINNRCYDDTYERYCNRDGWCESDYDEKSGRMITVAFCNGNGNSSFPVYYK